MSKIIISGRKRLNGCISIQGAKNSVLPILAATVLNSGVNVIENCPKLKDVDVMLRILESLGCRVETENHTVMVDSSTLSGHVIPTDLAAEMRSSVIFMGPILARCKKVILSYPGGCEIGPRPIDLHLKALKNMGARINDMLGGYIYCDTEQLKGADILLDYPSVGATENIMLAAAFADGTTYIHNAAKEPEIMDLQAYMQKLGIDVQGAGSSLIKIKGSAGKLNNPRHSVIPDRIVAGTYLAAAAITGGDIILNNVIPEHLGGIVSNLRDCGCRIHSNEKSVRIIGPVRPKAAEMIRTQPYPGFPTDMQAQFISLLSIAKGTSILVETVFENRYKHVEELVKMGASIMVEGRTAIIRGVRKLFGASVNSRDLRSGAGLVLAGLAAEGETVVNEIHHIERGYEDITRDLCSLGADIKIQQ